MPLFTPPQADGVSNVGNTQGNTGVFNTGTIVLSGGNNVTLSQSTNVSGATIGIAAAGGGAGGINLSVSTTAGGGTAGTMALVSSGTLSLFAGNNITLSQSGTNTLVISGPNTAAQTVQTQNLFAMSVSTTAGGATAGTIALISSGTLNLYAGNNITLSQSAGSRLVISGPNTTAQTVQTQNLFDVTLNTTAGGGTAGTMALLSSGTLSLVAGNNITLSQSGTNTIVISGPNTVAQTVQTQNLFALSASTTTGGATSGTMVLVSSGTLSLVAGNNITLSQSGTNTLVISAGSQSVQTQGLFALSASTTTGGATSGTMALVSSGTLNLLAGNNITLSQSGTNTLVISAASQTLQTQGLFALSVSSAAGGATSGTMALVSSGTLNLYAGNNITLSQGGTNSITIQGPSLTAGQTVQTQNLFVLSANSAAGGATTGTMASVSSGTLNLYAGSNLTLSQNNQSITLNAGGGGGGGGAAVGISTQGNTGGTTGFAATSLQLVATNLLTLSQATTTGGQNTITIVGPRVPGIGRYENMPGLGGTVQPYTGLGTTNGSMHLFPLNSPTDLFPGNMSALSLFLDVFGGSVTSTSLYSATRGLTISLGIYTLNGALSLSLLNSASFSTTFNTGSASASSNYMGPRYIPIQSSVFSTALTFSQTSYWVGMILSTAGQALSGMSWLGGYLANTASQRSGVWGLSATSAAYGYDPWAGIVGTGAIPTSINIASITKTGVSGGFVPHVVLEALDATW